MKANERLQALLILCKLLQKKVSLYHSLSPHTTTPLTKALCFGVCRYFYSLECLADQLVDKRPKSLEVWVAILMGLYQLAYMKQPDYAVVKETVNLLALIKKRWAKGFVNAVLRQYCQKKEALVVHSSSLQATYNHPLWLIKRLQHYWPHDWQAILDANITHPPLTLRVNQLKVTADEYLKQLEERGIKGVTHPPLPTCIELQTPCDVNELPGFHQGYVSIQDSAAQLAATLLDLRPGLRVLDACAAPGGKTSHILEIEPNLACCIAVDVDNARLQRVSENLERLQLTATLIEGDASKPATFWDGVVFDRILLDAPCSATGVIRRHPDIKLLREEKDLSTAAKLQQQLLHALWPLLAPNGRLVYATCSIIAEENEEQIKHFIASTPGSEALNTNMPWGRRAGYGWQILPGECNTDGFFYAVLKKSSC